MPITPTFFFRHRRHHFVLEAAVVRVHHVDGHLRRVPVVRFAEHLEWMRGSLWPVKPMNRDLALPSAPPAPL